MEFSTKVIETMAKIMAEEMGKMMPAPENIRTVETGMRELLRKVGAEALSQYLERADEAEPLEKEKECECQGNKSICFGEKR